LAANGNGFTALFAAPNGSDPANVYARALQPGPVVSPALAGGGPVGAGQAAPQEQFLLLNRGDPDALRIRKTLERERHAERTVRWEGHTDSPSQVPPANQLTGVKHTGRAVENMSDDWLVNPANMPG